MKEMMSRIQLALVFMSGWLRYSLAEIVKVAQVFASKSGSNIDEQVAQIFIDIHTSSLALSRTLVTVFREQDTLLAMELLLYPEAANLRISR